ncbi:FAS1-like dehydratase domain-containing protein [Amycolatopsis sp. H20-H5]|uniref:FAS1-like dehydratase domain-containing protein n=1 Tax=Amycolatopsis sp. H20-H5 TaxID=3046309 RepID=UPI002DB5AD45|nr:MaoC family dehydratase N-terminal domain-containing protein [Amycolatopsis sp. H20-H5]MEC3977391.1 MaoC family dehydratase N-terminal domain-containing protein [Amycolatopsis sp. H20-H5]
MAINREFIGRTYPPTRPYEVGREKIRDFAAALGETGSDGIIAPLTFPVVLSMRAEQQVHLDPELGLDFSRVVHREQEFIPTRSIRAGDRLTVVVTVLDVADAGGNDAVTTRADIRTVEGEHVCTAVSTMVAMAPG